MTTFFLSLFAQLSPLVHFKYILTFQGKGIQQDELPTKPLWFNLENDSHFLIFSGWSSLLCSNSPSHLGRAITEFLGCSTCFIIVKSIWNSRHEILLQSSAHRSGKKQSLFPFKWYLTSETDRGVPWEINHSLLIYSKGKI